MTPWLSNDELVNAINRAHVGCRETSVGEHIRGSWEKHFDALVAEQRRRAEAAKGLV